MAAWGSLGSLTATLYYRRAQLLSTVIGSAPFWKHRLTEQLLAA